MVTFFLPNTGSSLASARISRRFSGFCKSCCLMYSQTLRTTSPRARGPGPITAASSFEGCNGCCSPVGFWPPPPPASFFDPVGPLLALVGMVVVRAARSRLAGGSAGTCHPGAVNRQGNGAIAGIPKNRARARGATPVQDHQHRPPLNHDIGWLGAGRLL